MQLQRSAENGLCCEGELHASWSVSSDDQQSDDAENDVESQFDRSRAYKATRVFYNRSDQQPPELSANLSNSDSDIQQHNKPTGQSRTAARYLENKNKQTRDRNYINNDYVNIDKSQKFKSDSSAGGDKARTVGKRENYRHSGQERRNIPADTAQQERGNATSDGGRNDKSKQRNEIEQNRASLKNGRRETGASDQVENSGAVRDNMRYSTNRRSPRKWQLLPLQTLIYNRRSEQTSVPIDDRRPYRRNLPPRMLAKMKQTRTSPPAAATEDPVTVTSSDADKDSNVETTCTETDVTSGADSQQNEGEVQVDEPPKVTTNVWKEREEFYKGAAPRNKDEENYMLQLALEESQRQDEMTLEMWQTDVSQLTLEEFQALQYELPNSTDDVHSLLLEEEETSLKQPDNGPAATPTLEAVSENNVNSSGTESTLLSQLYSIERSPHLCQERNAGLDAFGLRDMRCVVPNFRGYYTPQLSDSDTILPNVQPSAGLALFPPGVQATAERYSSPFQQDQSLPFQHSYFQTTTTPSNMMSYGYRHQNALFPSDSQPAASTSLTCTDPSIAANKLQALSITHGSMGNALPQQYSASKQTVDAMNSVPFTPPSKTEGGIESQGNNKDAVFNSHRQLFQPPLASAFDKEVPDTGTYAPYVGTIGETKPVGFVPAVKGTKLQNEVETETESETVGQEITTTSTLTTTARVQPSSTVKPQQQQQPMSGNTTAETTDSTETGDKCTTTKDSTQPPFMPGYPAPWPMPPYPGAPFPYPFYPPWPYCPPPMHMMPMMPHPMMSMVPMPCWMPPMHPAMAMRPPAMAASAADANEKPEVVSEKKQ